MAPSKGENSDSDNQNVNYSTKDANSIEPTSQTHKEENAKEREEENNRTATNKEMSSKSQVKSVTWEKSSMKNVLANYGMPEGRKQQAKTKTVPQKKQFPQKKLEKKDAAFNDDYESEKEKAKRERHLKVYDDMQVLRDLYYKMYMKKLTEKVEAQREELRKKSEARERKIQAREEKQRLESHKVKKRLVRHNIHHDDDFVKNVPKSDHYKIVVLQAKLRSQGMLRTQEEMDDFWAQVRNPDTLRRYLIMYKPFGSENSLSENKQSSVITGLMNSQSQSRSRTSSVGSFAGSEQQQQQAADFRPMTQIEETREPSRPVTREPTGEIQHRGESSRKKPLDPHTMAKLAAMELDKKYPQMELPPMACFDVELGEKPRDPEEIIREVAMDTRNKERLLFVKRLRRMYHLSRSNGASAQRILTRHDDTHTGLGSPEIGEYIAIDEVVRNADEALGLIRPPQPPESPKQPWEKHLAHRSILPIEEVSEDTSSTTRTITGRSGRSRKSRSQSAEGKIEEATADKPCPLSLELAEDQSTVMKSKCMSTFWNNYLNVGTSKFAAVNS